VTALRTPDYAIQAWFRHGRALREPWGSETLLDFALDLIANMCDCSSSSTAAKDAVLGLGARSVVCRGSGLCRCGRWPPPMGMVPKGQMGNKSVHSRRDLGGFAP